MAEASRRYRIAGIDSDGDVHVFVTDDKERARAMFAQMKEDLEAVTYSEPTQSQP